MNENLYEKIKQRGNKYLELPAQHLTLVSAFNEKSRRVKRQILVHVDLGTVCIDHVFLVSSQLLASAILGVDFFISTSAIINFPERCALFRVAEDMIRQLFDATEDKLATINDDSASGETKGDVCHISIPPIKTTSPPIVYSTGEEHSEVVSETSIALDNDGSTSCRESHAKCSDIIVRCNEYDTGSRNLEVRNDDVAADYSQRIEKESSAPVFSITKGNEGHRDGVLIREYDDKNVDTIEHATPNTTVNCFGATTDDALHTTSTRNDTPDDRVITPDNLEAIINGYGDLSDTQREQLLAVLKKYKSNLTKRPGKYKGFEYHFNVVGKLPKSAGTRTIPFALRDEVRPQIQAMNEDGILEESYSDYVNPLKLVHREKKPVKDMRRCERRD
jgi:hypothetical protein